MEKESTSFKNIAYIAKCIQDTAISPTVTITLSNKQTKLTLINSK